LKAKGRAPEKAKAGEILRCAQDDDQKQKRSGKKLTAKTKAKNKSKASAPPKNLRKE
jgi:hypothetical protein